MCSGGSLPRPGTGAAITRVDDRAGGVVFEHRLPRSGIAGRGMAQRLQDGALTAFSSVAAVDHALQFRCHPLQVIEPGPNVFQMTPRQLVDLLAGQRFILGQTQQTADFREREAQRSEEHTSELQSLMRSSYAVFCLKK